MTTLMQQMSDRYSNRIVIYDLPPLLALDDSLVVLKNVEACLLVVRDGKTQTGEVQHSLRLLDGNRLIGTLLNHSSESNLNPNY